MYMIGCLLYYLSFYNPALKKLPQQMELFQYNKDRLASITQKDTTQCNLSEIAPNVSSCH